MFTRTLSLGERKKERKERREERNEGKKGTKERKKSQNVLQIKMRKHKQTIRPHSKHYLENIPPVFRENSIRMLEISDRESEKQQMKH